MKQREENANALLAQILCGFGIDARAESKGHENRRHPDILINAHGQRIVIEAEYGDSAGAAKDADARLQQPNPPDIVGALRYAPAFERDFSAALRADEKIAFAFKRKEDGAGEWEERWRVGVIYDLAQSLRRPQTLADPAYDEIASAVAVIGDALNGFYDTFREKPALAEKIARALQSGWEDSNAEKTEEVLKQSLRVAGLILLGALLFQSALAEKDNRVKPPSNYLRSGLLIGEVINDWKDIVEKINYAAIFRIAVDIIQIGHVGMREVRRLINYTNQVQQTAREGVDLMGRIYHRVLEEAAKPLGAFYTSIPAATLLAGLSLAPQKWGTDGKWSDDKFIGNLRIADLACGSGTLLAAACWKLRDNFMRDLIRREGVAFGGQEKKDPLREMQRGLLEKTIWGYDILKTATHLTAATLGLMSPEVDFRRSHIYHAVIGKKETGDTVAGSLELLESRIAQDRLFMETSAHVETEDKPEELSDLDLCIMNPPFVVGRANALAYSFLPSKERDAVRERINSLAKKHKFSNAGLGPAFISLAERYVKPGGRLAFILSTTLASGRGKAWENARARIEKTCDLEFFIVSRDPSRSNFSENTNLQECMFVARKRRKNEKPSSKAMFVILTQNPRIGETARATEVSILEAAASGDEYGKLRIAKREIGEFAFLNYRDKAVWDGIAFRNLRLTMAADIFADEGRMPPYSSDKARVPIVPFANLAKFGSHHLHCYINEEKHRRLHFSKTKTSYPGYYPGHYKRETGIAQKDIARIKEPPNCYMLPLKNCEEWTRNYFAKGGRIIVNGSFRFNTARRLASLISVRVQGANYQPIRLNNETVQRAKAMVLWLNSTPALLLIATHAVYCEGAKVMFSQQAAKDLPVLNLDAISDSQIKSLSRAFDSVAEMKLRPLPEMTEDPARKKIDNALKSTLKLDGFDFSALRAALAAEPIIAGKSAE